MKNVNTAAKKCLCLLLALTLTFGAFSAFGAGMLHASAENLPVLTFNKTVEGVNSDLNKIFSFQLVVPESGLVTITYRSANFFTYIYLYDDYDKLFEESAAIIDDDHRSADIQWRLKAGTYRVTFDTFLVFVGDNYGPYSITAAFESANETFAESLTVHNDRKEKAFDYTPGTQVLGQLGTINDTADFYRFELTEPGIFHIDLQNPVSRYSCRLHILDESDTLFETPDTEKEDHQWVIRHTFSLVPGVYYIEIETYYESYPYSFTTTFTPVAETFAEKQGALLNEKEIAPVVGLGKTYNGLIAKNDREDLYRITVNSPMEITAYFFTGGKSSTVTLFDYDGNMCYASGTDHKYSVTWEITKPGVYIIKVQDEPDRDVYGTYSFMLYQRGDTNHDFSISLDDARTALRIAIGLETAAEGTAAFLTADYDKNGVINTMDVRSILRIAIGLKP